MKQLILIVLSILSVIYVHAQEEAKNTNFVIGGSVSGNIDKNSTSAGFMTSQGQFLFERQLTNIEIIALPYIAKRISKNNLIGLTFRYESSSDNQKNSTSDPFSSDLIIENIKSRVTLLGFDFFYRHNLIQNNKFKLFIQPIIGYGTTFSSTEDLFIEPKMEIENDIYRFRSSLNIGGTYNILKKWNLLISFAGVSYQKSFSKEIYTQGFNLTNQSSVSNNFLVDTSLNSISLGLERIF